MTSNWKFFTAGGTLPPNSPSYVRRLADEELFDRVLSGEFCYVLTPRQMGKSSLMVRTANRLRDHGVSTAIIDLTTIGTTDVTVEQWYLGLITRLKNQLKFSVNPEFWWREHAILGHVVCFTDFLRDVILTQIEGQVVIFIDEIDTTLNLDFTDDFFAAIRAVYNARATDPDFNRLTFVLLGAAAPADLIGDRAPTPFNIGRGITLQEFSWAEAEVLQMGLEMAHPGQGEVVLGRIYYWTNGHPYLTQKLCLAAAEAKAGNWDSKRVDKLVESLFLSEEAHKETNLKSVHDGVQTSSNCWRLLTIYRQVYEGETVPDDDHSLDKNHLKLLGLVKSESGVLKVRNEIYRYVFNLDWVKDNTPDTQTQVKLLANWTRPITIALMIVALLFTGIIALLTFSHSQPFIAVQAQTRIDHFHRATNSDGRITNLAGLFQLPGYDDQARELFFNQLSPRDQAALFERASAQVVGEQLIVVVQGLYTHLDDNPAGNQLLQKMAEKLGKFDDDIVARNLATEIERWLAGRNYAAQGDFQYAIEAYNTAIRLNPNNIGTRFDRALVYAELETPGEALVDLNTVLEIVGQTASIPISTSLPTSSVENSPSPSLNVANTLAPVPPHSPISIPTPTLTATVSAPALSAQRFTSSAQISASVEERIRTNPSLLSALLSTLSADQTRYPNLYRIVAACDPYFDDFSDPDSNWEIRVSSNVRLGYSEGEEYFIYRRVSGSYVAQAPAKFANRYIVEVDARWDDANIGYEYGLIFGQIGFPFPTYRLGVNPVAQAYRLQYHNGNSWECINQPDPCWVNSPFISRGSTPNHLKVECNGTTISLYVNDNLLWQGESVHSCSGRTGLFTQSSPTAPTAQVYFDNFQVSCPGHVP
jgi:tetratricopeptide (TPR) repeat protein